MALSSSGGTLGATLQAIAGIGAAGAGPFAAVGEAFASWGLANLQVLPGTLAHAGGGTFQGKGVFRATASKESLGAAIAIAAGTPDAAAVTKWTIIGGALIAHFEAFGQANPSSFTVADPNTGGAVLGSGTLSFSTPLFVPPLGVQMGFTDAPNLAIWLFLGTALLKHFADHAVIGAPPLPTGFGCPTTGALTGVSKVT